MSESGDFHTEYVSEDIDENLCPDVRVKFASQVVTGYQN